MKSCGCKPAALRPRSCAASVLAAAQHVNMPLTMSMHSTYPQRPYNPRLRLRPSRRSLLPVCQSVDSSAQPKPSIFDVSAGGMPRTAVLGVLGGGQLGRMMALAAANLGVRMRSLDPTPDAPASICTEQIQGSFRDPEAIRKLCEGANALTVEIEHVDADALESCAAEYGIDVEPTPATLRTIQDKYAQKLHFASHGVPLPDFADVPDANALQTVAQKFGFPFMLKAKRLAYDGRGNFAVRTAADMVEGPAALGGFEQGLYAERWAPFVMELAVMVVRSRDGSVVSYPVVQTVHKDSICHVTEAPAMAPEHVQAAAKKVAENAIACLEGAGIFGVEMFLLADGTIQLNEVAPRPHNSGHYTMDACVTSQFENHVRAVMGWPLGDTSLQCGCSIMLNILGEADDDEGVAMAHQLMARAYTVPGAKVHWYGKEGVKKGRKVGHINIVAKSHEEARAKLKLLDEAAAASLERTSAMSSAAPIAQVGIIMGSDSDLPTMKAAAEVLEHFGIPLEVSVVSAHRTPERMLRYARSAHERGIKVIIAGAGGAAHLPGMVAACTPLPVIGVPVVPKGYVLDGMDAMLSILQMPKGVPVATVAIGNAANAGLLAVRILAAGDTELLAAMEHYQDDMRQLVEDKAARLERVGWREYGNN